MAATLAIGGAATGQPTSRAVTRNRLKQSVSRWCYGKIALPDLCKAVAAMGQRGSRRRATPRSFSKHWA